jgi:hypothetical protein
VLRTTVEPGDIPYLPRAAAHSEVGTGGELSAHLSLTVREIGTTHLYEAMPGLVADGLEVPPRPLDDAGPEDVATLLPPGGPARAVDSLIVTPRGAAAGAREGRPAAERGAASSPAATGGAAPPRCPGAVRQLLLRAVMSADFL